MKELEMILQNAVHFGDTIVQISIVIIQVGDLTIRVLSEKLLN